MANEKQQRNADKKAQAKEMRQSGNLSGRGQSRPSKQFTGKSNSHGTNRRGR